MRTFDLATGLVAALIALGVIAPLGGHTDEARATLASCERIDHGGYFTFADPACAALANSIEPGGGVPTVDDDPETDNLPDA